MTEPIQPDLPLPESHPLAAPGKPGLVPPGSPAKKRVKSPPKPPLPLPEFVENQLAEIVSLVIGARDPELNEEWVHGLVSSAFETIRAKQGAEAQKAKAHTRPGPKL